MKLSIRIISFILAFLCGLALLMLPASGEGQMWDCPYCGRIGNTGNYCGQCSYPAPWLDGPDDEHIVGFAYSNKEIKNIVFSLLRECNDWTTAKDVPYTFSSFPLQLDIDVFKEDAILQFATDETHITKGRSYHSSIFDLQNNRYFDVLDVPLEGEWVAFIHWTSNTNTIEWYSEEANDTMIGWDYQIGSSQCLLTILHPNYYKDKSWKSSQWHLIQIKYNIKTGKVVEFTKE